MAADADILEVPQLRSRSFSLGSRNSQIPELLIAIQVVKQAANCRPIHQRKCVRDLENPLECPHKSFSTPWNEVVGAAMSSIRRVANSQPVNASKYHVTWQTKINK